MIFIENLMIFIFLFLFPAYLPTLFHHPGRPSNNKSNWNGLSKVVIDVGKKEFAAGLTYVACSRVHQLSDLLFTSPFPFQRLANLSKSRRLQDRLKEDARLMQLSARTL